jgi:hypothetical protein
MGVWGWEELADGVVLEGIVDHVDAQIADDGDWNIHVRPAAGFRHLRVNPHIARPNTNGLVECEVEPPGRIEGEDAEDDAVFHRYMDHLAGKFVRVVGTWSIDCSHSYDGHSCVTGCCDEGKTEIHPVLSIVADLEPSEDAARSIEIFVFADSSSNRPRHVPHSHSSRVASFQVPIGPADPLRDTRAAYLFRSEVDQAERKSFTIEEIDGEHVFVGTVTSGTEAAGTGFYHAAIDLYYESRNPNPAPWLELLLLR